MAYRKCTEWEVVDYIYATCPYCGKKYGYYGCFALEGDILQCQNKRCKKKFVLGAEE